MRGLGHVGRGFVGCGGGGGTAAATHAVHLFHLRGDAAVGDGAFAVFGQEDGDAFAVLFCEDVV